MPGGPECSGTPLSFERVARESWWVWDVPGSAVAPVCRRSGAVRPRVSHRAVAPGQHGTHGHRDRSRRHRVLGQPWAPDLRILPAVMPARTPEDPLPDRTAARIQGEGRGNL